MKVVYLIGGIVHIVLAGLILGGFRPSVWAMSAAYLALGLFMLKESNA